MINRCTRLAAIPLVFVVFVIGVKGQGEVKVREAKLVSKLQVQHIGRALDLKVIAKYKLFIINDINAADGQPILHAYSMDSLKLFRSFINHGEAKDEMSNVGSIHYFEGESQLYAFDIYKQRFGIISLDSLVGNADHLITGYLGQDGLAANESSWPKFQFPILLSGTNHIIERHQNSAGSPVSVFDIYSSNGKLLQSTGSFPQVTPVFDARSQAGLYYGMVSASDKGDEMLYHCISSQLICLYDRTGNILAALVGYPGNHPNNTDTVEKRPGWQKIGYTGRFARMNAKEVFVLNTYPKSKAGEVSFSNMYIFNKKLRPQARYMLDPGILVFDIDWKTRRIFALDEKKQVLVYRY
jgi:hypothetical protein